MAIVQYYLPTHVFIYVDDLNAIWLHARKNKYIWQSRADLAGLSEFVPGWPTDPPNLERSAANAESAARELEAAGLLVSSVSERSNLPVSLPSATTELDTQSEADDSVRPGDILVFLWSCLRVCVTKRLSLNSALTRVRFLKRRALRRGLRANTKSARTRMKVFSRIRAYVYDSKQHCLFDSLVVIEYLAHYEL